MSLHLCFGGVEPLDCGSDPKGHRGGVEGPCGRERRGRTEVRSERRQGMASGIRREECSSGHGG